MGTVRIVADAGADGWLTPAVGGGVFLMLATLFTAMLRMVLAVSRRADTRSDSELERTRSDRDAERARADAERARADAAARRADEFEARYVELLERVKGIT